MYNLGNKSCNGTQGLVIHLDTYFLKQFPVTFLFYSKFNLEIII